MEIVLRVAVIYFFLWLVTKALGKRELAQMSPFELILLVTMGDLIQQGATQDDRSLTGAILAVATMATLVLFFSYLSFRFEKVRRSFEGLPVIVVKDGRPLDRALKMERLSVDELAQEARAQGVDNLAKVQLAVLEPDGQFSFLLSDGPGPQQQGSAPPDVS